MKRLLIIPAVMCFLTILLAGKANSQDLALGGPSHSEDGQSEETTLDFDSLHYEYEIVTDKDGKLDIVGTMEWFFKWPDSCGSFVLKRTNPIDSLRENFFVIANHLMRSEGDSILVYTKENIKYKTKFFGVGYHYDHSEIGRTSTLSVSSLVSSEDLALVDVPTSIIDESIGSVDFYVEDRVVNVYSEKSINLSLFDTYGHILYSGVVNGTKSIPVSTQIIIARYELNGNILTKKIFIK